jgi:acyl carrier protein
MNTQRYEAVADLLVKQFKVDPAVVRPDSTLEQLGLDSLTLMEFVFAVEDHFDVRIPEDKLDPRQAGFTLERVVQALDDELLAKATPPTATDAATAA